MTSEEGKPALEFGAEARFSIVEQLTSGFSKLGNRRAFHPALNWDDNYDDALFSRVFETAFGVALLSGGHFTEKVIFDRVNGVTFSVYSAQSGPAYGGSPAACRVAFADGDNRLRPEVQASLEAFEQLLAGRADPR